MFVGCNFSDPSFRVNYTSVIDVGAMKHLLRGRVPAGPLLLSTRAAKHGDRVDPDWRDKTVGIEAIADLPRDRTISRNLSMNSAQHGTVYSIKTYSDHDVIHLWGIDSFWSTDIRSTTDAIVRPNQTNGRDKPKITRQWHGYWRKIFSEHADHEFVIHRPHLGVELVSGFADVSNVRVVDERP